MLPKKLHGEYVTGGFVTEGQGIYYLGKLLMLKQ